MERLAFGVFLAISAVRVWGSPWFWDILCYDWLNKYETPNLIKLSNEYRRQSEFKKAANLNSLIYNSAGNTWTVSTYSTGIISDSTSPLPAISRDPDTGTMIIDSLKDKSSIQRYYYSHDLNLKIASSKYPNFIITAFLKLVFNVQWIPGPRL